MESREKMYRRIVQLKFPPENSGQPIMSKLVREFDVTFSILRAQITPREEGFLTLEISGSEANCVKGIAYLESRQIEVTPVAQTITHDENLCIQCGMCTAMCSTKALRMDLEKRCLIFESERCTGCALCVPVCPVRAIHIEVDNGLI